MLTWLQGADLEHLRTKGQKHYETWFLPRICQIGRKQILCKEAGLSLNLSVPVKNAKSCHWWGGGGLVQKEGWGFLNKTVWLQRNCMMLKCPQCLQTHGSDSFWYAPFTSGKYKKQAQIHPHQVCVITCKKSENWETLVRLKPLQFCGIFGDVAREWNYS